MSAAVRLRWAFDDLITADGHRLAVAFGCGVKSVAASADRRLFVEVFMTGNDSVAVADLVAHFTPALAAAAGDLARILKADAALSEGSRPALETALRKAGDEVAFDCGLEVIPPFDVEVTSPTLQQERIEQMQRTAAERRSADRVGHLARAADLLKQWESLKTSVPSITPGKLIEQLNPADRGAMLDTLLMATGAESVAAMPDLWAVAGPYLVRLDLKTDAPKPTLSPLPSTAGPLRSVRGIDGRILVGARSGILIVDGNDPDSAEVYSHPGLISEHGFSSVITAGDRLWGCHRGAGLVSWVVGQPDQPATVFSSGELGGDVKYLTRVNDDEIVFAVDGKLFRLDANYKPVEAAALGSPIVAVLNAQQRLVVATEDGQLAVLDARTMQRTEESRRSGKLTGAALLPWLSSSRVLLTRADGPIECVGLDDQLVTQFNGHTGLRAVTACGGKVAGMSSDRQRVVLWNAWDGRKPAGEIYLAGLAKHRVADITFV